MTRPAILIFPLLLLHTYLLMGQTLMNRDSLLKLLPSSGEDSNAVLLYVNIGQQYEGSDFSLSKKYYRMAGELSKKINYKRGIIKYITNYTYVLNQQGLFDSSLLLNLESVQLSKDIGDSLYLAKTLFNTGTSYRNLGDYEKAVEYYEQGKPMCAKFGDELTEAQGEDILQVLYNDMHNYNKAIEHGQRSISLLRKLDNPIMLAASLTNLGLSYSSQLKYEKSEPLFSEALKLGLKYEDKNIQQTSYLNLADNYLQAHQFEKMKPFMEKALLLSRELEIPESELIASKGLSFYYLDQKDYATSKKYAEDALAISYKHDFKIQRVKTLTQLSNIAFAMQNTSLGDGYAEHSTTLGDSILNETIQKNTQELEKKYETSAKEIQIKKLESDKQLQQLTIRQKSWINYLLLAGAIIVALVSLLFFRNYQQKQKLQQQRINELETLQQLTATEAVLKGEEQERTRLAKDLHDGLGGLLSGIKYSFQSMKGNLVMTPENAQAFERSMDMLDSSIKEMRRVAHNLMPEALVKFGLDTALKDFCNDINQSGALEVSYQSIGLTNDLSENVAISIYRVVQELINNSLKHAASKTAIVQVSQLENRLSITVEDDGKGFDTSKLEQAQGIGWSNIKHRVDFLKGKLDVHSQEGKGTSVLIEFYI